MHTIALLLCCMQSDNIVHLLPAHKALWICIVVVEGKEVIKVSLLICQHAGEHTIPT